MENGEKKQIDQPQPVRVQLTYEQLTRLVQADTIVDTIEKLERSRAAGEYWLAVKQACEFQDRMWGEVLAAHGLRPEGAWCVDHRTGVLYQSSTEDGCSK